MLAWKDLKFPGALMLAAGIVGGLVWIVAGWAIWTRRPWAEWFAAGVHALGLVLQIVFLGPWSFWTLVLAVMLWIWIERARHPRPA